MFVGSQRSFWILCYFNVFFSQPLTGWGLVFFDAVRAPLFLLLPPPPRPPFPPTQQTAKTTNITNNKHSYQQKILNTTNDKTNNQTNTQTNKRTNKQTKTNKRTNEQTNKQTTQTTQTTQTANKQSNHKQHKQQTNKQANKTQTMALLIGGCGNLFRLACYLPSVPSTTQE